MPEQMNTEVELLKRDMELLGNLASKFDIAIDRLTDVSQSVDKMLAVHESRLQQQESQAEIIHQRISDMKKEMIDEIKELRQSGQQCSSRVEARLEKLEKWRWFVVGIAAAVGFIVAQFDLSKLFS
tara:strand:- start:46 stop:423 length:378 start_codon:yes stop_codon:yes gene_type:complete